jgi:hypothetical protein
MRVGEVIIPPQMERTGCRVRPNDPVVRAVLSGTALGPEEEKAPVRRPHAFSQGTGLDQTEKQYRGAKSDHDPAPDGVPRASISAYGRAIVSRRSQQAVEALVTLSPGAISATNSTFNKLLISSPLHILNH